MGKGNERQRVDVLLVEKGYYSTREKAKAAIMAGEVKINGEKIDKAGKNIEYNSEIEVAVHPRFVSRGGLKLEKAVVSFDIDLKDRIVLDVGAATGGFTDCALQYGAKKVYAVDVGYGQLDWNIRNDYRVKVMERTNIRYLEIDKLDEAPDFFTIDVSFISLTHVLPRVKVLTAESAHGIALIKPQFEAGREKVGKKGVVRDPAVHVETINKVCKSAIESNWGVLNLDYSPVKGPEGNIEYLVYLSKRRETRRETAGNMDKIVTRVVESAHLGIN